MKKKLLIVTAIVELPAGLSLVFVPSFVLSLLFGIQQESQVISVLANITGAAMASLGISSWFARNNSGSRAVIAGIMFYNIAVAGILVHTAIVLKIFGTGLWPAACLHSVLAVWCVYCIVTNGKAKVLKSNLITNF